MPLHWELARTATAASAWAAAAVQRERLAPLTLHPAVLRAADSDGAMALKGPRNSTGNGEGFHAQCGIEFMEESVL